MGSIQAANITGKGGNVCLFPSLNLDHELEETAGQIEVPLYQTEHSLVAGLRWALSLAWSLLLGQFAESDVICFAVQENGEWRVYQTTLDPFALVATYLNAERWTISNSSGEASYNSGIVMKMDGGNDDELQDLDICLSLVEAEQNGSTTLTMKYKAGFLSAPYAGHISTALSATIESILRNPNQHILDLLGAGPVQANQITSWQTSPVQPSTSFIYEIIARLAHSTPDAVAVDAWDGTLTYSELNQYAISMAVSLQEMGVGCGTMVPVCVSKSRWAIVAFLAINRAGGAFVPCDPGLPTARLEKIVARVSASVAIASPEYSDRFTGIVATVVPASSESITASNPGKVMSLQSPTDAAAPSYCLFTSGSTGEPKGCLVSHSALASVSSHADALHVCKDRRALQFASFSFGVSLIEVWVTLAAGATICIPSDQDRLNGLADFITAKDVNWAFLTPTVLDSLRLEDVSSLKVLIIAGEPMRDDHIRSWAPALQLYQGLGFTEWAGICTVSRRISSPQERTIIGRPANARCWLVDPDNHRCLMPIGAVGELVTQGPSLADGYLGDSERTSASFFSHPPWLAESSASLYKTGDLMRYTEDGQLSYVRRKDNQVKLRGQRVELGEVEYQARMLFASAQRVVAMVIDPQEIVDQRVLALLVVLPPTSPPASAFRFAPADEAYREQVRHAEALLQSRLPAYMVPHLFLPIEELPKTITGKTDRRSLQQQLNNIPFDELQRLAGIEKEHHGAERRAPETPAEMLIHRLTCEVLHHLRPEEVCMRDNFFNLAGNSVAAMKLAGTAKRHSLRLTVKDIFARPVLADMAAMATFIAQAPLPFKEIRPFVLLADAPLDQVQSEAARGCRVQTAQVDDIYPCTSLQEGLMALTERHPTSFRARFFCRIRPDVSIEAFRTAWESTIQANDILRTRIISLHPHGLLQVVVQQPFIWDNAVKDADDASMGLGDALVRACIVADPEDNSHQCFVLTIHHALCDRWSIRLVMEQVQALYQGETVPRNRFVSFIEYVRERISSDAEDFWRGQFQGLEAPIFPSLPSPQHHPVPSQEIHASFSLPPRRTAEHTSSTYVRLAWALVLSHNTSSDDVVFGTTVTGRGAPVDNIAHISGPTIATVPLRFQLNQTDTVSTALARVQDQALSMVPYEQAGLQNIRGCSEEAQMACMFQSQLIVQPPWDDPTRVFSAYREGASVAGGFSAYGISLECQLSHDERNLSVCASYDPDVLTVQRVDALLHHLDFVLKALLDHPERTLEQVPHLGPQDLMMRMLNWTASIEPGLVPATVHGVFAARAQETPDAPAVAAWDGGWTYQELHYRSTVLAGELMAQGVRPGSFVPILLPRSCWTPVAQLAVNKAGGAFLLLDRSHPRQRLETIYESISAELIIASETTYDLAASISKKVVALSESSLPWNQCEPTILSSLPCVRPSDPVYIIFTSGSSGKPKGVVIEHQAYASAARAHQAINGLGPGSRMLQCASYAFDVSIMEALSTLLVGACMCIISEQQRNDDLFNAAKELRITHAIITPTIGRVLHPEQIPTLRSLIVGGEMLSLKDRILWGPKMQIILAYGPAECCVLVTYQIYDHHRTVPLHPRDVGRPIASAVWITDPRDPETLMPVGAVGEMLVEGPIVGREYLNAPEQTAEAFIDPPSWLRAVRTGSPHRVYRTGDLAQYNDDGTLRLLGRINAQAKLRGQRLELQEVEHHIQRCWDGPAEVVAAVITPADREGHPCLAAFILAGDKCSVTAASGSDFFAGPQEEFGRLANQARNQLQQALPDYMVPSIFAPLVDIPRTAGGKLDRRRLQNAAEALKWEDLRTLESPRHTVRPPSTEQERVLQGLWAQILNVERDSIGVDDNFFRLGGDSITAMQVVAHARTIDVEHSVEDLFRLKTIERIAKHAQKASVTQLAHADDQFDVPFALSPVQKVFFAYSPDGAGHYNQNILLHIQQPDITAERVLEALARIVKEHAMLRSRFVKENGEWQQLIRGQVEGSFAFREHDIASLESMPNIISESQKALDLSHGPLFSADWIVTEAHRSLFLVAHHLVVDIVSWRVIVDDLEHYLADHPVPESRPTTSFQTWCKLQAKYASQKLEAPSQQAGVLSETTIQRLWDFHPEHNTYESVQSKTLKLSSGTSEPILGAANQALNTQPVELLHAALLHAFMETFVQHPVPTITSEAHGRQPWDKSTDLARTVGWFTTLAPVEAAVERTDDIFAVARKVKDTRRADTSNGWEYFTALHHGSKTQEDMQNEAIEIVFNYAGRSTGSNTTPDSIFRMESLEKLGLFDTAPDIRRFSLIDINAFVVDGALQLQLTFPDALNRNDQMSTWLANIDAALQLMASEFPSAERQPTLADFPSLPRDEKRLNSFVQALSDRMIPVSRVQDVYPSAPIQRGILLSQVRDPAFYRVSVTWEVAEGEVGRVQRALDQLIARHDILRTVFLEGHITAGSFDQVLLHHESQPVAVRNEAPPPARSTSLDDKDEPFFPYSFTVYAAPDNRVYFRFDTSHSLVDARTFLILERDFGLAYDGRLTDSISPQYGDFISYVQERDSAAAAEFWDTYLEGVEPCLFPTTEASPEPQGAQESEFFLRLPPGDLQAYCRLHNVTSATAINLAWAMVLRQYTGLDDVCFGQLNSGRGLDIDDVSEICGPLINVLTCRVNLDDATPVSGTLQRIQEDFVASLPHQTFSIADVLHRKGVASLFNTILSVQNAAGSNGEAPRARIVDKYDPTEYEITLNIDIEEGAIRANLRYWDHKISPTQASLIGACFEEALGAIVQAGESIPRSLQLFSEKNRALVHSWNSAETETRQECFHDIFQQRARETPDAPAICSWDGQFTYAELDRVSTQIAQYLLSIGVGLETPVPLCFEKSCWALVSMVAVAKAGAMFCLLDPSHPEKRLEGVCEDLSGPVILTSPEKADLCGNITQAQVVVIGGQEDAWLSMELTQQPLPQVKPTDAVYAVYTSGSTGKPKGIIIEHGAIATSTQACLPLFQFDKDSRIIQFAAYTFDISIFEMVAALIVGGCLCILSEIQRRDYFAETVTEMKGTHVQVTPSFARLVSPETLPTVKGLVLAGEAVLPIDRDTWASRVRFVNAYGPAECSGYSVVQAPFTQSTPSTSIGRGAGCTGWVTDPTDHNQLVPVGVIGELVLEGGLVGRGYLNNDKASQAAFIDAPQWLLEMRNGVQPSRKLYKTGDLVRYDTNGMIHFVGRKDTQVKVRGQRIELGETEYHVQECFPEAREVVVEVVKHRPQDASAVMVAFVRVASDCILSSSPGSILSLPTDLFRDRAASARADLQAQLPSYMVASLFVPLETVPLTPSGKADRKGLRAAIVALETSDLSHYRPVAASKGRAPETASERLLQKIWADALHIPAEDIGADDDFFHVGGDSISAMKVAALARDGGLDITVVDMFASPKLSKLATAAQVDAMQSNDYAREPFSLSPIDDHGLLAASLQTSGLIPPAGRVCDVLPMTEVQWFFLLRTTLHHFTFNIKGALDLARIQAACAAVFCKYSILRTMFTSYQGQKLQLVLDDIPLPFHRHVTDTDLKTFRASLWKVDASRLEAIKDQMPCSFTLISNTAGTEHALIFRLTHAQWDAVSLPDMFNDVALAYTTGQELSPVTQFTDAVYYRQGQLTESTGLSFWRDYLQGSSMTPLFDVNHKPGMDLSQGETIWPYIDMKPPPTPPKGITLATVVKTAWSLVLAHNKSSDDIVFGHTVNARNSRLADIDHLLGPCLNFIPVRVRLNGSQATTGHQLLDHIQHQYQDTLAYDHIPMEEVVEKCTDWAQGTQFSSIVQHQNITLSHSLPMGDQLDVSYALHAAFRPQTEVFIFTEPYPDNLQVQFCVNPNLVDLDTATKMLGQLCRVIRSLAENPETLVGGYLQEEERLFKKTD